MERIFKLGDILDLNGTPCVVVGLSGQILAGNEIPEEHIAVWFGDKSVNQKLGDEKSQVEVQTIPAEYFKRGLAPVVVH